jgi:hypothetical protein
MGGGSDEGRRMTTSLLLVSKRTPSFVEYEKQVIFQYDAGIQAHTVVCGIRKASHFSI